MFVILVNNNNKLFKMSNGFKQKTVAWLWFKLGIETVYTITNVKTK